MFDYDNEIIAQSLSLWANYIETGDVNARSQNNELSASQLKFVDRLRKLSLDHLSNTMEDNYGNSRFQ